eukprot:5107425-Amphidinium_carterae.1
MDVIIVRVIIPKEDPEPEALTRTTKVATRLRVFLQKIKTKKSGARGIYFGEYFVSANAKGELTIVASLGFWHEGRVQSLGSSSLAHSLSASCRERFP